MNRPPINRASDSLGYRSGKTPPYEMLSLSRLEYLTEEAARISKQAAAPNTVTAEAEARVQAALATVVLRALLREEGVEV